MFHFRFLIGGIIFWFPRFKCQINKFHCSLIRLSFMVDPNIISILFESTFQSFLNLFAFPFPFGNIFQPFQKKNWKSRNCVPCWILALGWTLSTSPLRFFEPLIAKKKIINFIFYAIPTSDKIQRLSSMHIKPKIIREIVRSKGQFWVGLQERMRDIRLWP